MIALEYKFNDITPIIILMFYLLFFLKFEFIAIIELGSRGLIYREITQAGDHLEYKHQNLQKSKP